MTYMSWIHHGEVCPEISVASDTRPIAKYKAKITDKSWIRFNKQSDEFLRGVDEFIKLASPYVNEDGLIKCPCKKCLNHRREKLDVIGAHIRNHSFHPNYTMWYHHGEEEVYPEISISSRSRLVAGTSIASGSGPLPREPKQVAGEPEQEDEMTDALLTLANEVNFSKDGDTQEDEEPIDEEGTADGAVSKELISELWPGCEKMSAFKFLVKLMHLKVTNKWTNRSFDMLCDLLKSSLPGENKAPGSYHDAKIKLGSMGFGYESIHVCKYDCSLFWKEYASADSCHVCGHSRWAGTTIKGEKVPHKVLRYFPIKERLRRLFSVEQTAQNMTWHQTGRSAESGVMRHPADGEAWKEFDRRYPDFAAEPRNVRFGLAADGPVHAVDHVNPGPSSPGKDMDIFLRPLVDELKDLWENGLVVKDAVTCRNFKVHAALLWTVNDFPARRCLSGWSWQGSKACPSCNNKTPSVRGRYKVEFVGHRRWLSPSHPYRKNLKFNGKVELRKPPQELTTADILQQLQALPAKIPGKHPDFVVKKRLREPHESNWLKKSIFFELPYWPDQRFKHNLDVMHIEKNVCDSLLGTILNIKGKSTDTDWARVDLMDLDIRQELHFYKEDKCWMKPHAQYALTENERTEFASYIKSVRFPDGFAINLQKNVNDKDGEIRGLKAHDCHVIMQQLLAPGVRKYLPNDVSQAIVELCNFFKLICARTLKVFDLEKAQKDIILILCKLELIFPPTLFDIFVHLIIHLPDEAIQGGPVHNRWIYPFERYIGTFRQYVRDRAHPEGSIAMGYIVNEASMFCSMYFHEVDAQFDRPKKHLGTQEADYSKTLSVFRHGTELVGEVTPVRLDDVLIRKLQWYILNNCTEVDKFRAEHKLELKIVGTREVERVHQEQFASWFVKKAYELRDRGDPEMSEELFSLANGSTTISLSYSSCVVNGVKFVAHGQDVNQRTQNSGVFVAGVQSDPLYGELKEVIVMQYMHGCSVVLMRCKWFDTDSQKKRLKTDQNITSIYTEAEWYKDDSFVLSTQAQQVFYTEDLLNGPAWKIVHHCSPRHMWDLPNEDVSEVQQEAHQETTSYDFRLVVKLPAIEKMVYRRADANPEVVIDDEVISFLVDTVEDDDFDSLEDDTILEYVDTEEEKEDSDEYDDDEKRRKDSDSENTSDDI